MSGIAAKNKDYLPMLIENTKGKLGSGTDIVDLKDKDISYGFLKSIVRMENEPDAMNYYTDKDIKVVANQYALKGDTNNIVAEELDSMSGVSQNIFPNKYLNR